MHRAYNFFRSRSTITFTAVSLIGRCRQSGHAHAASPVRGNFKPTYSHNPPLRLTFLTLYSRASYGADVRHGNAGWGVLCKVSPTELESVLRLHPDVQDAAVIGVKDDVDGDLPRALVVPRSPNIQLQHVIHFVNGLYSIYIHFPPPEKKQSIVFAVVKLNYSNKTVSRTIIVFL